MPDIITIADLKQLLRYDSKSGMLTWLPRPLRMFNSPRVCNMWNMRFSNKPGFTSINASGYYHGSIWGASFLAHRVAWALYHGEWPCEQIDHINGIRSDNRISNLRSVSRTDNRKNQRIPRRNTSGHIGVSWMEKPHKWHSKIKVNKKTIWLGSFDVLEDAVSARKAAELKYGFHRNHGRA